MDNIEAGKAFREKGIQYQEFNNGMHMRIVLSQFQIDGHIDFWPSREKWIYGDKSDVGLFKLLDFVSSLNKLQQKATAAGMKHLSVAKIFDIAKRVTPQNLYSICEAIHEEIYKK